MSDTDYDSKLDELDRLLNDPDSPMDPSKVWTLLAEVSQAEACAAANCGTSHPLDDPGAVLPGSDQEFAVAFRASDWAGLDAQHTPPG